VPGGTAATCAFKMPARVTPHQPTDGVRRICGVLVYDGADSSGDSCAGTSMLAKLVSIGVAAASNWVSGPTPASSSMVRSMETVE
jgi:hypothetical protein